MEVLCYSTSNAVKRWKTQQSNVQFLPSTAIEVRLIFNFCTGRTTTCTYIISNLHCVNVILQVRDKFGARVIFPQKSTDDDAEVITIIGRKEKAEAARDHLKKLIKDLVSINDTSPTV